MTDLSASSIGEIVTGDFRTAAIFEKYSLDFCCRGGKTIEQACSEKSLDPDRVLADLQSLATRQTRPGPDPGAMPADQLVGYIVETHHAYVRSALPAILAHTQKVASVHGEHHPEVIEIARRFATVAEELQKHMQKEERILFPYVKQLSLAAETGARIPRPPFQSALNPIRMMEAEHQFAGDEMYGIRSLSSGYVPPGDACTTYRVSYQELEQFELDLHRHVHLENNILFPRAIALEESILI